jgi:hypothetical protein
MNTKDTTTLFLTNSVNRASLRRSSLMLRRLTAVFLVAVGAVIFALSALADRPTRTQFEGLTFNSVLTDVCAFPVNVDSTISGTEIDYVDQSGALTRIFVHQVEQDTFTANGRTRVGTPFTFNTEVLFDSSGNVTHTSLALGSSRQSRFRTEVCSSALVGWISRSIQALRSSCRPIWETRQPGRVLCRTLSVM